MRIVSYKLLIAIVITLLVVSGCSTQFGYRFADTFIEYQLGKFVELEDPLAEDVSASIDELHIWHAQTQMPAYAEFLMELMDAIEADRIDAAQLNLYADKAYDFWRVLRQQVEPYAQEYLPRMTVAQRQQLIKNLRENLEQEREEDLNIDPRERQRERFQRTIERAEEWLGRLEPEQLRLLHRWIAQRERNDDLWFAYQLAWLDAFEQALSDVKAPNFTASVHQLITNPEQWRSDELQQSSDYSRALTIEFFVEMYATLSTEQKRRIRNKLADYHELVTDIHQDFTD